MRVPRRVPIRGNQAFQSIVAVKGLTHGEAAKLGSAVGELITRKVVEEGKPVLLEEVGQHPAARTKGEGVAGGEPPLCFPMMSVPLKVKD